ncbi:unnamed protein product [Parajaminaea phylloscopi]
MVRPTAIRSFARSASVAAAFRPTTRALASSRPQPQFQPHVGRFAQENVQKWLMTFGIWGAGLGGAATLFLSSVPIFQHDVLDKIPFVRQYYVDKVPDSDKPF